MGKNNSGWKAVAPRDPTCHSDGEPAGDCIADGLASGESIADDAIEMAVTDSACWPEAIAAMFSIGMLVIAAANKALAGVKNPKLRTSFSEKISVGVAALIRARIKGSAVAVREVASLASVCPAAAAEAEAEAAAESATEAVPVLGSPPPPTAGFTHAKAEEAGPINIVGIGRC